MAASRAMAFEPVGESLFAVRNSEEKTAGAEALFIL
jgi:hypothetical protein